MEANVEKWSGTVWTQAKKWLKKGESDLKPIVEPIWADRAVIRPKRRRNSNQHVENSQKPVEPVGKSHREINEPSEKRSDRTSKG